MTRAFRPRSLSAALTALSDPAAVPVAGCTDLLVVDTATGRHHPAVVDLLRVPELRGIRVSGDFVELGAASTFAEIRRDELVRAHAPILAEAAATIGGWQIQNRATIGGNIANASPVGDSLPVLLALDAELVMAGEQGERRLAYTDFHVGYRKTALLPGELIVRVCVPVPSPGRLQRFKKVGTREAQAISKIVLAFCALRHGGRLGDVRLAAGAVAETPVRLRRTEALLEGATPDARTAERAAEEARSEVTPIDDVRSTARYRSFVLGRVVRRTVLETGAERPADRRTSGTEL